METARKNLARKLSTWREQNGIKMAAAAKALGVSTLILVKHGRLIVQKDSGSVLTNETVQNAYDLNDSIGLYLEPNRCVCRSLANAVVVKQQQGGHAERTCLVNLNYKKPLT